MKKHIKGFLLLMIGILFLVTSIKSPHMLAAEEVQRVYDNAGLLTNSEIKQLETEAEQYSAKWDINYLIVTSNDTKGLSSQDYSEAFYDNFVKTYGKKDCTILTIDMSQRYADISGQGKAYELLGNQRCTKAFNKIKSDLKDGNYYKACSKYMKTVHRYLGIPKNIDPDSPFLQLWFQILVPLIIGAVTVGIMLANSGGKVTVNQGTYLDNNDSSLLARRDQYLHTTTTRVPKPRPDTNSGGDSGGGGGDSGSHGGGNF